MATNPIGGSPSPVTFPNQLPPMPAVARILSRFDRDQLHGFIAVAIDLADALDGDPDVELNGDEQDSDGDERGDPAYLEWHTRGAHKMDRHGAERLARDQIGNALHEDAEDDDPDTCAAADDQGSVGGRWFDTDGLPGDREDAEDNHGREEVYD